MVGDCCRYQRAGGAARSRRWCRWSRTVHPVAANWREADEAGTRSRVPGDEELQPVLTRRRLAPDGPERTEEIVILRLRKLPELVDTSKETVKELLRHYVRSRPHVGCMVCMQNPKAY